MRIVVAGASGAVGKALVPVLIKAGHEIAGLVRRKESGPALIQAGAAPLFADALNKAEVHRAIAAFNPDAVVHQMTALPAVPNFRDFDKAFAQTNQLRTIGTDNLLAAAREVGARRFVAQSFAGWPYARTGGPVKSESDPLDPDPSPAFRRTLEAIQYVESAVAAARDVGGISLRYGAFYGPGTALSGDGWMVEQVRRRRLPLIGKAQGVWSFIHVADVATATLAALESESTGTFNVTDDEPAPVAAWLPFLAEAIGAKTPRQIPYFIARVLLPSYLLEMMTVVRGASNARFKQAFSWQPGFASWREGFRHGL